MIFCNKNEHIFEKWTYFMIFSFVSTPNHSSSLLAVWVKKFDWNIIDCVRFNDWLAGSSHMQVRWRFSTYFYIYDICLCIREILSLFPLLCTKTRKKKKEWWEPNKCLSWPYSNLKQNLGLSYAITLRERSLLIMPIKLEFRNESNCWWNVTC